MTFKEQLKEAFKEGLLLLVKYGLLVAVVIYALFFSNQTYQAARNGEQAAIAIMKLQQKGYLPQFVNGEVPDKK